MNNRWFSLQWADKGTPWIWWRRLDRRNGYLAWGPVGTVFNKRKLWHWLVAAIALWRYQ